MLVEDGCHRDKKSQRIILHYSLAFVCKSPCPAPDAAAASLLFASSLVAKASTLVWVPEAYRRDVTASRICQDVVHESSEECSSVMREIWVPLTSQRMFAIVFPVFSVDESIRIRVPLITTHRQHRQRGMV